MRDFKLTADGDVDLSTGDIQFTSDDDLKIQRIMTVLGTTKGEWKYDEDEGINTRAILAKNPNESEIIDNIRDGLLQVDEDLVITSYTFEVIERRLYLKLYISGGENEEYSFVMGTLPNSSTPIVASLDADTALRAGNALEALTICAATIGIYKAEI